MRVEVKTSWAVRPNEPSGFRGRRVIEPCFGIGHNLSLICQLTSEDIKQHFTMGSPDWNVSMVDIDLRKLHCYYYNDYITIDVAQKKKKKKNLTERKRKNNSIVIIITIIL